MKFGFATIYVSDINRSLRFYVDVLGLELVQRFSPRPGVDIVFLKPESGSLLELIEEKSSEEHYGISRVSLGFTTDDLDAAIRHMESKGVSLIRGPIDTPSGVRLAFFADPDGVEIEFVSGFSG